MSSHVPVPGCVCVHLCVPVLEPVLKPVYIPVPMTEPESVHSAGQRWPGSVGVSTAAAVSAQTAGPPQSATDDSPPNSSTALPTPGWR